MRLSVARVTAVGWSGGPRAQVVQTAGVLGVLALAAAIPVLVGADTLARFRAQKAEFTLEGAPCPTVARPGPQLLGRRPMKSFTYGEATFGRKTGHASCAAIDEGGPFRRRLARVCQFNAPWLVSVTSGGRTRFFYPGAGRPATVRVSADGRASCVLAGEVPV